MNLVDQIFQQAQSGSANGAGFGEYFVQGQRTKLEADRINLAKQQLAQELALQPLKQTLLQQESTLNEYKLQEMLETRQSILANEDLYRQTSQIVSQALSSGNPEDAEAYVLDAQSRGKGVWRDPRFHQLLQDARASTASKAQLATLKGANPTAAMQNSAELNRLQRNYALAQQSNDPAAIARAKTELDNFSTLVARDTETLYDTATGNPVLTRGPATAAGGLTVATRTNLQKAEITNAEATTALTDAIDAITKNPWAIGLAGKVGAAYEGIKGQMNPTAQMETPYTDTQQKAALAFSRVAPALRVDSGNMSRYELQQLEQAGSVLDVKEGPQAALNKLRNLQNLVTGRQLRAYKLQNMPAPDPVLKSVPEAEVQKMYSSDLLDDEELARMVGLGVITPKKAADIYNAKQGR